MNTMDAKAPTPRGGARAQVLPDVVALGEMSGKTRLTASARLLGTRIDTRAVLDDAALGEVAREAGLTFVLRYGVAVTIGPEFASTDRLDAALQHHLAEPIRGEEVEIVRLAMQEQATDRIGPEGQILLADLGPERLQLAAIVLARNVVLSRDETLVSETFDRMNPLVQNLRENGRVHLSITPVMRMVGDVLNARHRILGTVQADERPDLLWDHPELDRLYTRLEAEYELRERAEALERKFGALGDFAEVLLDIVRDKRAYRLELSVIALIAFEIILSLIAMIRPW